LTCFWCCSAYKKACKKAREVALKLTPATLTPLVPPLAGSTRSINNALTRSRTTSIAPKASAANKRKKLSTPPSLGPLKLG